MFLNYLGHTAGFIGFILIWLTLFCTTILANFKSVYVNIRTINFITQC